MLILVWHCLHLSVSFGWQKDFSPICGPQGIVTGQSLSERARTGEGFPAAVKTRQEPPERRTHVSDHLVGVFTEAADDEIRAGVVRVVERQLVPYPVVGGGDCVLSLLVRRDGRSEDGRSSESRECDGDETHNGLCKRVVKGEVCMGSTDERGSTRCAR